MLSTLFIAHKRWVEYSENHRFCRQNKTMTNIKEDLFLILKQAIVKKEDTLVLLDLVNKIIRETGK